MHKTLDALRAALATAFLLKGVAASGAPARAAQVSDAANRAATAIQASQRVWSEKQACVSCHHQFQPAIALAIARQHGLIVDDLPPQGADRRGLDQYNDLDTIIQFTEAVEPSLQEAYRLVAAHATGITPSLGTAIVVHHLLARQKPDGSWTGLNQRPPSSSSDFTKVALASRAIQLFAHHRDASAAAAATRRAAQWLRTHRPADTESATYQVLGQHWSGEPTGMACRDLAARQRPDGGWASVDGRPSEAYSTGEALFALGEACGRGETEQPRRKGIDFLLRTQAKDGTWHVPSRLHAPARLSPPYFESGYPYGHDQFISIAGASWALMALARTLPVRQPPQSESEYRIAADEQWIESAMFGTLAHLRQFLDSGGDPNMATPRGGTSLLMMVGPSVDKLQLLLARGAQINATAATGFTALMAAAQHPDGEDAVALLLDRGATVRTAGAVQPAFPLYALALAANAGNAAVLERLHAAGDPVTERYRQSRFGPPELPLTKAIRNGEIDVVRVLLDLGAGVARRADDPWSPLDKAVHNNRVDLAQLLLARGADVNEVDGEGYTPLLLAASVDFGNVVMIDLLLRAGADVTATTPSGQTALDLARAYGHARFIPLLERRVAEHARSEPR